MDQIVIQKLHDWLGKKGRHFFRTLSKLYKGDIIPVMKGKLLTNDNFGPLYRVLPHPVHLREGMAVRNKN